eukprot:COSAG04_NODE_3349_length_2903_cov_1.711840_3_plen_110_part_00
MLADAAAPFIYLMAGKLLQEKLAPMDWSLFVKSETSKAKYRTSWTRVVTHSEAIAALAGGETEHQLLDKRFDEFTGMTRTINRALVPFNAYQKLFCACSNGRLGLLPRL